MKCDNNWIDTFKYNIVITHPENPLVDDILTLAGPFLQHLGGQKPSTEYWVKLRKQQAYYMTKKNPLLSSDTANSDELLSMLKRVIQIINLWVSKNGKFSEEDNLKYYQELKYIIKKSKQTCSSEDD